MQGTMRRLCIQLLYTADWDRSAKALRIGIAGYFYDKPTYQRPVEDITAALVSSSIRMWVYKVYGSGFRVALAVCQSMVLYVSGLPEDHQRLGST